MKILYIFPHPDDESFGPAGVIHQQVHDGHQVYLLTLTKGEATKIRYKMGVSESEMAEIRFKELTAVAKFLKISQLDVLSFKDGTLAHMDPFELEDAIRKVIEAINPEILVTYPVHGISGHHDHLTTHFVVTRLFKELRQKHESNLKRLAFLTLPREDGLNDETRGGNYQVNRSLGKYIDAVIELSPEDRAAFLHCLDLYKTFQQVIEESRVKEKVKDKVYFEIFMEDYEPPLKKLESALD